MVGYCLWVTVYTVAKETLTGIHVCLLVVLKTAVSIIYQVFSAACTVSISLSVSLSLCLLYTCKSGTGTLISNKGAINMLGCCYSSSKISLFFLRKFLYRALPRMHTPSLCPTSKNKITNDCILTSFDHELGKLHTHTRTHTHTYTHKRGGGIDRSHNKGHNTRVRQGCGFNLFNMIFSMTLLGYSVVLALLQAAFLGKCDD